MRNLERAGVPRSVAMKLTGHKTESIYRRYAIVSEADLSVGVAKLAKLYREQTDTRSPHVRAAGMRHSRAEVASPTTRSANQMIAWLQVMDELWRVLNAAA